MKINFNIIGKIKNKGVYPVDLSDSVIKTLKKINYKMENNEKLIGVQFGGVLGDFLWGEDLNMPLENYYNENSTNHLMVIGNLFCPVDYLRFLSRFFIRELKITTAPLYDFNRWIEGVAQGKGEMESAFKILNTLENSYPQSRFKEMALNILNSFRKDFNQHIHDKRCSNGICRPLIKAQCINACPSNVNIPGYISLMKKEDYLNAYKLMRQSNPFSFICGKICSKPCEERCRRNEIEHTVGVRALQKFASEKALKFFDLQEEKLPLNNKTVGIIGAGPAGLSAAYYLQKNGYQVNIYEAESYSGGILSSSIPTFRLSSEDINLEVKTITDLGVNIFYNHKVGTNISLEYIKNKYDILIIATGASLGKHILPTENNFIFTALDFLKKVKSNKLQKLKDTTIVVGGGDVAIDTARTALRLGSSKVKVISIEDFDNLPASWDETLVAIAEGIEFESSYGIHSIDHDDKFVVNLKKALQSHNLAGKFAPILEEEVSKSLEADHVILAIGQQPDLTYINDIDIVRSKNNFIEINKNTFETSLENVYAIGDVTKTGTAIEAISHGKKVASYIHNKLFNSELYLGEKIDIPTDTTNIKTWDYRKREEMIIPPPDLSQNFQETTLPYTIKDAMHEADRCLRCDQNSNRPLFLRDFNN